MAINGLGDTSIEQLLAMSMVSNGQLTSDGTSGASETNNESSLAFALVMQNLLKEQNESASSEGAVSNIINKVSQSTLAGTKLKDLAMALNNYNVMQNTGKTNSSTINNISSASENSDYMNKVYKAVDEAASKYGVDKNLILAVIKQESDFDSSSTSECGATGLMQIMPSNFSNLGIVNGYDINQNIDGGTKLLKEYMDQYGGNIEMALMAYNGGPGTIQRRGVSGADDLYKMPSETQNYVPNVMGYYKNGI